GARGRTVEGACAQGAHARDRHGQPRHEPLRCVRRAGRTHGVRRVANDGARHPRASPGRRRPGGRTGTSCGLDPRPSEACPPRQRADRALPLFFLAFIMLTQPALRDATLYTSIGHIVLILALTLDIAAIVVLVRMT